jgi:lipid A 3-O-deacylase
MAKLAIAAGAALLVLAPARAHAEEPEKNWTLTYTHENDLFDEGHDRNYTVGQLISFTSAPKNRSGDFLYEIVQNITPIKDEERRARIEFSLAHAVFTPEDLTRVIPDPTDRPYAGLVVGSVTLMASSGNRGTADRQKNNSRFDSATFSFGVLGPASRADDLQIWFHDVINGVEPRGWDSQIQDRYVGGLSYQTTSRVWWPINTNAWQGEVYTHGAFSLGTIQTSASLGASIRIGQDTPEDYGLPRLLPAVHGGSFFTPSDNWGWYAFAGYEQRYIAYDVTLDEAPANGIVGVDRNEWVSDTHVGAAVYFGPFRGGYSHVWRSNTFRSQRSSDAFGAFSISAHLWF